MLHREAIFAQLNSQQYISLSFSGVPAYIDQSLTVLSLLENRMLMQHF